MQECRGNKSGKIRFEKINMPLTMVVRKRKFPK